MQVTPEIAARNNAELCHAVLAAHGIAGTFAMDCWHSFDLLPELYPNLVTLQPDFESGFLRFLKEQIAGTWAIKDSFASLDLAGDGFVPVIDATWLYHPDPAAHRPEGALAWEEVKSPAAFGEWAALWGRQNPGLARSPMTLALLAQPALRILAGKLSSRIVAGCILNPSADAIGLSNLFHTADAPQGWLANCLAYIARAHPGLPVIDYETEDDLSLMLAHEFQRLGPLRVWLRSG